MNVQHPTSGALCAAALTLTVAVAGCGSEKGASKSSPSTDTAATSGLVAAAKASVAKASAAQAAISLPALTKKPPTGLKLALLGCPLPVCKQETDGATAGAKALGWSVKLYTSPLTPEGYLQTWGRVLKDKPDAIGYLGLLPSSAAKQYLAAADAAKIPTVVYAPNGDKPADTGAPQAAITGDPVFVSDGRHMGAAVLADGGSSAKVVFVNDPTFAFWTTTETAFTAVVRSAGGSVEELEVASAGIGKEIPSAIVSYLQRKPDVKYVALAVNDFSVGLPEALQSAGLSDTVKVISRAPSPANMTDIAKGRQWASVADENTAAGWRITDALARQIVGDPIDGCCKFPDGWHQIITKDNATDGAAPQTPGVPDAFLTAWHVAG